MSNPYIKDITHAGELMLDVSGIADGFGRERGKLVVVGGPSATLINNDLTSPATGVYPSGLDLGAAFKNITMVVIESGTITTHVVVKLEGSLDGTNWYQVVAGVTGTGSTPATGTGTTVHAKYLRANITTQSVPTSGSVGLTVEVAAS